MALESLLGDKKLGSFKLEIAWIKAIRAGECYFLSLNILYP